MERVLFEFQVLFPWLKSELDFFYYVPIHYLAKMHIFIQGGFMPAKLGDLLGTSNLEPVHKASKHKLSWHPGWHSKNLMACTTLLLWVPHCSTKYVYLKNVKDYRNSSLSKKNILIATKLLHIPTYVDFTVNFVASFFVVFCSMSLYIPSTYIGNIVQMYISSVYLERWN